MNDAVVSIGAGTSQLGLIEAARARGLAVIGVDRDERAAGLARCAAAVRASTHDAEAVLAGLRPLAERFRIRAVLTQSSGRPVATAALAARALGLAGLDPLRASLSTTKAGFAELCAEACVAAPATAVLDGSRGPEELPGDGPMVFKPSSGAVGKHGVVRAASRAERAAAYDRARAASTDGVVVAQEFVAGDDFALVALFHAGETRVVASLDERVCFGPDGEARGAGVDVPSRLAGGPAFEAARAATERLARTLCTGVGFFAFRAPADTTDAAPRAIEAHLDLGGDFVSDVLLARGAGVDLAGLALALHLEQRLPEPPAPRPARLTFLYEEDRPRLAELMARGEAVCDVPPVGRHGGGRVGWLLEARP
jgi:hypothetical protein